MNINDTLKYQRYGLPEDIRRLKDFGDYEGAIRLMDHRMKDPGTPEVMKKAFAVQKMICRLLPTEFPYSREDALGIIRESIPGFTDEEFDEYVCIMDLDEDEMYRFLTSGKTHCPYYRQGDDYTLARRQ